MADIINVDPHAGNQNPQPYNGEVHEYTTPGTEVKHKIDKIVSSLQPQKTPPTLGDKNFSSIIEFDTWIAVYDEITKSWWTIQYDDNGTITSIFILNGVESD